MAKYGDKASEKVGRELHELKEGSLRSGSGSRVKSKQQAVAIGLSEARAAGGKVPEAPSNASVKAANKKPKTTGNRS